MERYELKFWNKNKECITFGFKTCIILEKEEEVEDFLEKFICKGATEVTIDRYKDNKFIESNGHEILE